MAVKLSVGIQTFLLGAIMAMMARLAATQDIAFQACNGSNYLERFPGNCFKFLMCSPSGYYVMDCPANLVFSVGYQRCDYRYLVPGCENATVVDKCLPNPCVRGTCVQDSTRSLGYRCDCYPGFTGADCAYDIDECANSPCYRGVCQNSIGSFSCDCGNNGYTGQYCEIVAYTNQSCVNGSACQHGTCQPTLGGNFCSCQPGYKGALCDQVADPCSPSPCLNNGTCSLTSNNVSACTCPRGYSGARCEEDVNECDINPSLCFGGTCINTVGSYRCDNTPPANCSAPYPCPSDVPSYNYPAWADNNCRSYYNCAWGSLTLRSCPLGQKFDVVTMTCQSELDANRFFCDIFRGRDYCNPSPCLHGSCVNNGSAAVCTCEPGYTGPTCNTSTLACPKYPCPTDVPLYMYPAWNDTSCRSYYRCARGTLDALVCPLGQKFDVVTMSCQNQMDSYRFFCDAFKM